MRRLWHAAHFCQAGDYPSINPWEFSRQLTRQLWVTVEGYPYAALERAGITLNINLSAKENQGTLIGVEKIENLIVVSTPAPEVFDLAVASPLRQVLEKRPNQVIFILVDALDEATKFPGGVDVVKLLANWSSLPANVRFLLTCRNDPEILAEFSVPDAVDLSGETAKASVEGDIRRYLTVRLSAPPLAARLAQLPDRDGLAARLVTASEQNFLYIKLLLDDVETGGRAITDLNTLPQGLYGLYRTYLDRLVPDWNKDTDTKHVLGLLSVAMRPVAAATLATWLGRSEIIVNGILNVLAQIIPRDAAGYRLYHRSLAEFFAVPAATPHGPVPKHYLPPREAHEQIARFYLGSDDAGRDEDCTRYGIRYLSGHLRALAGQEEFRTALYEMISARVMAQKHTLTGSHQAFVGDVRAALDVAGAQVPPDIAQVVKCSLVAAELASRTRSSPENALAALARLGRSEEAIARTELMPDRRNAQLAIGRGSADYGRVRPCRGPAHPYGRLARPQCADTAAGSSGPDHGSCRIATVARGARHPGRDLRPGAATIGGPANGAADCGAALRRG